ncbi:MAG: hypothetical protein BM562_13755 [Alphaproteobacteria bacterium MedPE-SWcel]|nr:MAG: hypothetical protein BM562_13755 [Alphaproteobacteria bacterium MedPE-SWcel]
MAIDRFPGNLRVGVLNKRVDGVLGNDPRKAEPKVSLLCLLSGFQKFRLGTQAFELDARRQPHAMLFHSKVPLSVVYEVNLGHPLIKTVVSLSPEWIDMLDGGQLPDMVSADATLDYRLWHPAPGMTALVNDLVESTSRMCRMTLGLDLLNHAVEDLRALSQNDRARVQRARSFIHQNLHRSISSRDVAQACGIGLRTLQRLFADHEGTSLGAYLRLRRVEAGREAIVGLGLSVAEAAYRAGYSTPENFATAIKRAYGVAPSQLRPPEETSA